MNIPRWFEQLFIFDESSLASEEKAFVRGRVAEFNERMTKVGMILSSLYLVIGMLFAPYILIPQIIDFSLFCHSVYLVIIALAAIYNLKTGRPLSKIAIFMHLSASTLLTYFAYVMLNYSNLPDVRWLATITLVGVSGWLVVMCPSQYNGWRYVAAYHVAVCMLGISLTKLSATVAAVSIIVFGAFIGAKIMLAAMIKREAYKTLMFKQLGIQSERQAIEHELSLARNIQDSMLPPGTIATKNAEILIYRSTHDKVGGDWVAYREFKDGSLVLFVIDAVGKGIQAALVVHAVQSLWARSLSDETFDAKLWLREVNNTLLRLGEREAHSATAGLFEISKDKVTYWCAGHPPAWCLTGEDQKVEPIMSRGDMLGIKEKLFLQPMSIRYPKSGSVLVFGSDGVFEKGTRYHGKDIVEIVDLTLKTNELPVELCTVDDDRTLVIVRFGSISAKAA